MYWHCEVQSTSVSPSLQQRNKRRNRLLYTATVYIFCLPYIFLNVTFYDFYVSFDMLIISTRNFSFLVLLLYDFHILLVPCYSYFRSQGFSCLFRRCRDPWRNGGVTQASGAAHSMALALDLKLGFPCL
jgi:hypothetical protein